MKLYLLPLSQLTSRYLSCLPSNYLPRLPPLKHLQHFFFLCSSPELCSFSFSAFNICPPAIFFLSSSAAFLPYVLLPLSSPISAFLTHFLSRSSSLPAAFRLSFSPSATQFPPPFSYISLNYG